MEYAPKMMDFLIVLLSFTEGRSENSPSKRVSCPFVSQSFSGILFFEKKPTPNKLIYEKANALFSLDVKSHSFSLAM
jgi:hypothetical protein